MKKDSLSNVCVLLIGEYKPKVFYDLSKGEKVANSPHSSIMSPFVVYDI